MRCDDSVPRADSAEFFVGRLWGLDEEEEENEDEDEDGDEEREVVLEVLVVCEVFDSVDILGMSLTSLLFF
jgi:hypothetical protein